MSIWFTHLLAQTVFVLSLIFIAFALKAKRPPGSTMAWLIFIFLVPYVAIPFYILLSQRKILANLPAKKFLYPAAAFESSDPKRNELEKMLMSLGTPPPRTTKDFQLISSGQLAIDSIVKLITDAKKSIFLTTFIFANDKIGNRIVELLELKVREGLKVNILIDSFGASWAKHPSFVNFRKAGGSISYFMPFFQKPFKGKYNLRNHRKMLIVDSQFAIVGGMNIAEDYMGSGKNVWIDVAVQIDGEAVQDLEQVFTRDWEFATGEKLVFPLEQCSNTLSENQIQIIPTGPDLKDDPLYDLILNLIYHAKERIWIATPYFIPDDSLSKALALALRRGVEVKIWVPNRSNHLLADFARRSYLHDLFSVGADILYVQKMMHGKALMIDTEYALSGSANFDMRSLFINYEIGIVMFRTEVILSFKNWFETLPAERLTSWPKRGFWSGLVEEVARVLGPLI